MHAEGLPHDGIELCFGGARHRIDFHDLTGGKQVMVYGQTEVTRDLMQLRAAQGLATVYEAEGVSLHGFDGARPSRPLQPAAARRTSSRATSSPAATATTASAGRAFRRPRSRTFERVYPFGWLGVLSETPPVSHELIYSNHERGFALCSMRSATRSRYYVQCALDDQAERWSDDAFWAELRARLDDAGRGSRSSPGRRSRRASRRCAASSPSRCASAACSSPATPRTSCRRRAPRASTSRPATSACCARAFAEHYRDKSDAGIDDYSARCLRRVWRAERFSWWFTSLMHKFPETGAFGQKMQAAELDYLVHSRAASTALAENYVGLPL